MIRLPVRLGRKLLPYKRKVGAQLTAYPLVRLLSSRSLSDLDRLYFNVDLHVVPDHDSTGLERLIPGQAEITPIDLATRAESDPVPAPRISRPALKLDFKRDWSRHVADRQVSGKLELLLIALDFGAPESDLGEQLGVQKIRRTQVLITLIGSCVDAYGLECRFYGRIAEVLLIAYDRSFDVRDSALHGRDHQVLGGEFDQGM